MEVAELQQQLEAQAAENALLQQQAAAAQENAAKLMEASRQELHQLQADVHRLEQEKLVKLKAWPNPQLTTAPRTAAVPNSVTPQEAIWEVGSMPGTEQQEEAFAAVEQLRQANAELERKLEEAQVKAGSFLHPLTARRR